MWVSLEAAASPGTYVGIRSLESQWRKANTTVRPDPAMLRVRHVVLFVCILISSRGIERVGNCCSCI